MLLQEKVAAVNQEAFKNLLARQKSMVKEGGHTKTLSDIAVCLGLDKGYFKMAWQSEDQALTNALGMTCVGIYPFELSITDVVVHGWGSRVVEAFLDRWDEVSNEDLPACMVFKACKSKSLFIITDAHRKFNYAVPAIKVFSGTLPNRVCAQKAVATAAADRAFYVMSLEFFAKAWTGAYLDKEELV